jgi:hypothetical protein
MIMDKIIHYIEHLLGWNCGTVVSAWAEDGTLWIGFQCVGCGKIGGRHGSKVKREVTTPQPGVK